MKKNLKGWPFEPLGDETSPEGVGNGGGVPVPG